MRIVDTKTDRKVLFDLLRTETFFMDVVPIDVDRHAAINSPCLVLFKFMRTLDTWCLPIDHTQSVKLGDSLTDLKSVLQESVAQKLVIDKKTVLHYMKEDVGYIDLGLAKYLDNGSPLDGEYDQTNSEVFMQTHFRNIRNVNRCVPIFKLIGVFEKKCASITSVSPVVSEKGFVFLNDVMSNCFHRLEANGMRVDEELFVEHFGVEQKPNIKNGMVYTQYNLFTATGRPSNRFGGVNYAAIKKSDGSRQSFISRHGNDGMLVMMDFNAFHPRLIAHLINYSFSKDVNPYEYLARYYFPEIQTPNEEDVAVSKGLTFQMMYGNIDPRWKDVPYFKKIQEYIDHRWKYFQKYGYIETPIFLRKIKPCHIEDPTPSKVFNYIIQAYETEMASVTLNKVIESLQGKKTCPVLYTYDSILFDVHKDDKMETIREIKRLMEGEKFPVKVYVGKNYHSMDKIDI